MRHIALMREVDLLLVAPLTAETLAKFAHGHADHLLTQSYLAFRGPVVVFPAMNTAMLEHPATQRNLDQLRADGVRVILGESGALACGETGPGRMAEPELIAEVVESVLTQPLPGLKGARVLVTAGPTREALDPVRYLTNRSSGRMGLALARALRNAGAIVTLVHGPINERLPWGTENVAVTSAAQMADAVLSRADDQDVLVLCAAVADYAPVYAAQKLKKDQFDGQLKLNRTQDILASLGQRKRTDQILVGFAAESENVTANARRKLESKNLDLIFANDISRPDGGFEGTENALFALGPNGFCMDLGHHSKTELATQITSIINTKRTTGTL